MFATMQKFVQRLHWSRLNVMQKNIALGLAGVVLLYVAVAGAYSFSVPWMLRGDTHQHLDYIWRIYHDHQIPVWSDGITYQPFIKVGWGNIHESASSNPPLFYMLQAPIVGPIMASGAWQVAVGVGRSLNILTGILCIGMLAWGAWLYGGQRRHLLTVAVPALAVLTYNFTRLNLDYAIDAFVLLLTTWSLVLDYKLIYHGPQKRYLIATLVVSIMGMATKAPYVLFLGLNLLAVVVSYMLYSKAPKQAMVRGAATAAGIAAAVVAVIGWFYYFHNYRVTGVWYAASPSSDTGGRVRQSLSMVLHNPKLWALLYSDYGRIALWSTIMTVLVLAGWLLVSKSELRKVMHDQKQLVSLTLLGLAVLGTFVIQIKFAVGAGAINFRYMIPALLPIGLFLAYGLLRFENARGQLVVASALMLGLATLHYMDRLGVRAIFRSMMANGLPGVLLVAFGLLFVIGAVLLSLSMFRLSKRPALPPARHSS